MPECCSCFVQRQNLGPKLPAMRGQEAKLGISYADLLETPTLSQKSTPTHNKETRQCEPSGEDAIPIDETRRLHSQPSPCGGAKDRESSDGPETGGRVVLDVAAGMGRQQNAAARF